MARSRSNTSSAQASEVPLYRRLVDALRADIANGTHPIGTRLPTENALCRRFGVSRHTVREALRVLRDEGLVASWQGAGTTALRRVARSLYTYTVSSVEELLQYASDARYQVDKSSVIAADGALAEKLGCPVGQRWLRVKDFVTRKVQPIRSAGQKCSSAPTTPESR